MSPEVLAACFSPNGWRRDSPGQVPGARTRRCRSGRPGMRCTRRPATTCSARVRGLLSADAAELSLDLAGAYPPEAGICSWRRTIRLDRASAGGGSAGGGSAGGGKILIEDAWGIDHSPERTVVYLIAAREPRLVAEGRLMIPADDGNLAIDYPHADFDAGIEERPVDDPRLAATWGPNVYRITIAARHPGRQGKLHLEIDAYAAPSPRSNPAS